MRKRDESDEREGRSVFMRDRIENRVRRLAGPPRWHERPAALGHLTLAVLAAVAALNLLAVLPIG